MPHLLSGDKAAQCRISQSKLREEGIHACGGERSEVVMGYWLHTEEVAKEVNVLRIMGARFLTVGEGD